MAIGKRTGKGRGEREVCPEVDARRQEIFLRFNLVLQEMGIRGCYVSAVDFTPLPPPPDTPVHDCDDCEEKLETVLLSLASSGICVIECREGPAGSLHCECIK